jgi:CBS-domain-containing membrane protein
MTTTTKSFFELTAADLASERVVTIESGISLRVAARLLAEAHVRGAPVVDADGRCIGVLSVSDLARWAIDRDSPPPTQPRACSYQDKIRRLGGEVILCKLPPGSCPIQRPGTLADGTSVTECAEPHCIPTDWQIVELESVPEEDVRHYMTSGAVTVDADTMITDLARCMADNFIQRVVIVDDSNRPVGVVSSSDLIGALAAAEPPSEWERGGRA